MLNAGFKRIAAVRELDPATVSTGDGYLRLMLRFAAVAEDRIASVRDKVRLAESRYETTLRFYGEPAQQSDTFFALFQVFLTSYKRVKADNAHRAATERRRKVRRAPLTNALTRLQQLEEEKEAKAAASPMLSTDRAILDDVLEQLREGSLTRTGRRQKRQHQSTPSSVSETGSLTAPNGRVVSPEPTSPTTFCAEDPGAMARGLLQQLKVR